MPALEEFVAWLTSHEHRDAKTGNVYRYHSRSDAHSIALCSFILSDLLAGCPVLREQAARGEIAYGINLEYRWPSTGKAKRLDLAIGRPATPVDFPAQGGMTKAKALADVLISCEAKSVMTEHGKAQPRVYDELSSSHEIVHQGRPDAVATGITVVNIAPRFVSPLRQAPGAPLYVSVHNQPRAAERMIQHLRGLPIRENPGQVGFDAYCTVVVDTDNQGPAHLWSASPAPQPGDPDSYGSFITRIAHFYTQRFAHLPT
jgi:hypothetical protein